MKEEASKVIMGATLAMAIALSIVLALVLILLADLYCSLLLRHRRNKTLNPTTTTTTTATIATSKDSSLRTLYSQGVLDPPPRNILFPNIENDQDLEKQDHLVQPKTLEKIVVEDVGVSTILENEHFAYIRPSQDPRAKKGCPFLLSNPIYDNEVVGPSGTRTPFETPESSPSHLETSDDEDEYSPPLMPMKKLQAEACSVSLRDASSLATSCSDGDSNNTKNGVSSSTSGSPRASPSW